MVLEKRRERAERSQTQPAREGKAKLQRQKKTAGDGKKVGRDDRRDDGEGEGGEGDEDSRCSLLHCLILLHTFNQYGDFPWHETPSIEGSMKVEANTEAQRRQRAIWSQQGPASPCQALIVAHQHPCEKSLRPCNSSC